LICKVHGTADSVAFSEYAIPIKVLESEAATQGSIAPNVWGEQESGYTIPIYSGSFGARLADAFDPATDTVARVTLVDTTTTNTDMRGTDGANTVAPDNASIAAILVDTGADIPASIAALNDFDPATDTVANVTTVGFVTNPVTTDSASRIASQTDVSALSTSAEIAALNDITAADVWSYATRTVTSGGGTAPADTYAYFVQGGNEDVFKADVSALASQSSVDTVSGNVNSVKSKTDQLTFTVANQVDSNALSGGGGSNVGSGAISHEITVNVGGSPSDGVEVWVTTDSSGANVVAGTLVTDAFGKASFMLDAGSYYLWAQKSGANFTNPTSFSVS
jgi:hypothetical protein